MTTPVPDQAAAPGLRGHVLVSYAVDSTRTGELTRALEKAMVEETVKPAEMSWDVPVRKWKEKDPSNRTAVFLKAFEAWPNPGFKELFEICIRGFSAELQEGELLPFQVLVIRFDAAFARTEKADRSDIITIAQRCRDFTRWLVADAEAGPAETVVVTTEMLAQVRIQEMKDALNHLREAKDFPETLPESIQHAPPGQLRAHTGFSHFQISRNLHAILGPLHDHFHNGPGWIVHVFEEADSGSDPNWGTGALRLIDPLQGADLSAFVEQRVTGLPVLLTLWSWLQVERHGTRRARQQLMAYERSLQRPRVWTAAAWAWKPMARRDAAGRARVHQLRALRDEYLDSMKDFLHDLEGPLSRETWVPPPGVKVVAREDLVRGAPMHRLVRGTIRELERVLREAEAAWDFAQAQKESYKVRIERFLGLALLLVGLMQAVQVVAYFWPGIVSLIGRVFGR